jgi:hypothetical protein
MYLTRSTLRNLGEAESSQKSIRDYFEKRSTGRTRVFLSHSHIDVNDLSKQELYGLMRLLLLYGGDIYIDWLDPDMPKETSSETAVRLKGKIDLCDRFLLLATENAINSKWVPWELGYADKAKGIESIAIIPIADPYGHWSGSEYLALYPRVLVTKDDNLGIYQPCAQTGRYIKSWFNG